MTYYIKTYGCQMNKSDTERIASVLELTGLKKTDNEKKADIVLINACAVRQSAIDRIHGHLNKLLKIKKQRPVKTILTGCVPLKDKEYFAGKFDLFLNTFEIQKLPELLGNGFKKKWELEKAGSLANYFRIQPRYESKFKAFVPIMTGCNNYCTYCIVPLTRGREIDRPHQEILTEIENLVEKGYKEITLLGQNVNSYGTKRLMKSVNAKITFPELLEKIDKIKGEFWIRFISPHPKDFSDRLINVLAKSKNITEFINLPAQSGDDDILKKMGRHYTIEHYCDTVKKIREKIPNAAISTDIIVGFPGETKEQFQNSVNLLKKVKYDMAFISQFSPRPGTAASLMDDNVTKSEKKQRDKILNNILKRTAKANNQKYLGREIKVLIDGKKKNFYLGKSRAFKTVKVFSKKRVRIGDFVFVKITKALEWGLEGML